MAVVGGASKLLGRRKGARSESMGCDGKSAGGLTTSGCGGLGVAPPENGQSPAFWFVVGKKMFQSRIRVTN